MLPLSESFLLTSENQTYSTSSQISKTLKVNFQKPEGEPAGDEVASDLLVAASPPSPPPLPPILESPDQIFGVKINYELASSENQSPKPVECLESKIRQCESWKKMKTLVCCKMLVYSHNNATNVFFRKKFL